MRLENTKSKNEKLSKYPKVPGVFTTIPARDQQEYKHTKLLKH